MNIKPEERFIEYPKLQELLKLKDDLIQKRNHNPVYIKEDLKSFDLTRLGLFDVILMDPPWQEYDDRLQGIQGNSRRTSWTLQEIGDLPIDKISETPSFLFLWVGSEHLENGRELFKKWGYKRCEDIVWVKTNKQKNESFHLKKSEHTLLQRVKEHCLVGLRGDVKRASDSHFIHANIDTDVIVDEEPPFGSTKKPKEIYDIIERFCLGRKRLELFGETHNIRNGWLTIGQHLPETNFNLGEYNSWFEGETPFPVPNNLRVGRYVGTTIEIENLRPKSPTNKQMMTNQGKPNMIGHFDGFGNYQPFEPQYDFNLMLQQQQQPQSQNGPYQV